jgi:hypothetical protein
MTSLTKVGESYMMVAPLFSNTHHRLSTFFKSTTKRRAGIWTAAIKYLGDVPPIINKNAYHIIFIKHILFELGVGSRESEVCELFGIPSLPMVPTFEFDTVFLSIDVVDKKYGVPENHDVEIVRRRSDGYVRITNIIKVGAYDGVAKKTASGIIGNMTILQRRMNKLGEKKLDDATKLDLAKMYSDTDGRETWVHPTVFVAALSGMSVDFQTIVANLVMGSLFG